MFNYTIPQWFLIFFIYCFLGWLWECLYVSYQEKKLVNRGFMHGPFLPIYGCGAILLLKIAGPFGLAWWKIYIIGMVFCTIMEYITGALMERLFHVRYWDYTEEPFNFKGHICLGVSLAWGAVAIFINAFIHRPVDQFVLFLPGPVVDSIVNALMIIFAVDFTLSFIEAMDLKSFLEQLSHSNETIKMIQQKMDSLYSVMEAGMQGFTDKFRDENKQNQSTKKKYFERVMEWSKQEKMGQLVELRDRIAGYLKREEVDVDELKTLDKQLLREEIKIENRSEKEFRHLTGLLRRNPKAVSRRHKNELDELMKLNKNTKNQKSSKKNNK